MGNVIEFLARLGEDASLRHASDATLATLASEAGVGDAVGNAMVSRDPEALRTVLGYGIFFSSQMPVREVEEPEDDEGDEDEGEDEEDTTSSRHTPKPLIPGFRH